MNPEWLVPWAEAVAASESFVVALDAALAEDAVRRAGIDVRQGFALLPDDAGTEIAYASDESGHVAAVLVAVSFGYDVAIGWRCAEHPGERLAPSDPLARGCRLSASFVDLPADELRAKYSGPVEPPFPLAARSFPVQAWALVWPDLWFEVHIAVSGPAQGALLQRAFEDAAAAWNENHSEATIGGVIAPKPVGRDAWEVFLSFGDDGPAALNAVLASVESAVPGITRVVVRSFPVIVPSHDRATPSTR